MNDSMLVFFGVGALVMRLGTALYLGGMCRAKNAGGAMFRHIADLLVTILCAWAIGDAVFAGDNRLLVGWGRVDPGLAMLVAVTLIATGIVVGAVSERSRFMPMLVVSAVTAAIIVPLGWRWAWGWMSQDLRFIDIGGASFAHCAGAAIGLVAIKFVGPRLGKYNHDGSSNVVPGHFIPMGAAGVLTVAIGFFPYMLGCNAMRGESSVSLVAADLFCAAAAGGLAGMSFGWFRFSPGDTYLTYCGFLGGLVAVSGCAGRIDTLAAVAIGIVAGVVVPFMSIRLELHHKVDDPSAMVAIHGVGGALGTLAAGLSLTGYGILGRVEQVGLQLAGLLVIIALAAAASAFTFFILARVTNIRLGEADEFDGIDLAEHDLNSYPDFQQTTIKSYHLRES
jgi:Amt family ammonium transporter